MKQNKLVLIVIFILFTTFLVNRSALTQGSLQCCKAVQSKVGFIRYPLGTVGVWSTEFGEIAEVMTRLPRKFGTEIGLAI